MRRRGLGRGRPSLIGTAARTAVVAGTASAVAGSQRARAQQAAQSQPQAAAQQQAAIDAAVAQQLAAQNAAAPAAPASGGLTDEMVQQLRSLAELRDAGILTDAEFDAKKSKILGI